MLRGCCPSKLRACWCCDRNDYIITRDSYFNPRESKILHVTASLAARQDRSGSARKHAVFKVVRSHVLDSYIIHLTHDSWYL
jgi:hypothetical protein